MIRKMKNPLLTLSRKSIRLLKRNIAQRKRKLQSRNSIRKNQRNRTSFLSRQAPREAKEVFLSEFNYLRNI